MTPPVRLETDPRVARAAWRYASESRPGRTHDAALMIGPDGRPFWDCTCESYALGGRACKHVRDARRRWAEELRP